MIVIDNLLEKPAFLKRIKRAAYLTYKTGLEAGFYVLVKKSRKYAFGDVTLGDTESWGTQNWGIDKYIYSPMWKEQQIAIEGSVHFHPDPRLPIVPSSQDLMSFVWEDPLKWSIIGQSLGNKSIALLCLDPLWHSGLIALEDVEEWGQEEINYQEEISEALGSIGLSVALIIIEGVSK